MSTDESEFDILPRKTKTEEAELDITPMIDIVFLLLAFFVMVSKMDPQVAVDLPEARAGVAIPEKNCVVFVVTPGDEPDTAKIYKGRSTEDSNLVQAVEKVDIENEVTAYVEERLSAEPQIQAILIKAEGEVRHGDVELVRRGISSSTLAENRQIYAAVDEAQ